jgi:hypothetical protein
MNPPLIDEKIAYNKIIYLVRQIRHPITGLLVLMNSEDNTQHDWLQNVLQIILLNTLPTAGPSISRIAITTMATKTKIKAYSTSPWPSS